MQWAAKGASSFMAVIYAIAADDLEGVLYTVSLLASVLPEELLLI